MAWDLGDSARIGSRLRCHVAWAQQPESIETEIKPVLFEPERHERVTDRPWDEGRASIAIEHIVADTIGDHNSNFGWPVHPLDHDDPNSFNHHLYFGTAGVIWGLEQLRRLGATDSAPDFTNISEMLIDVNRRTIGSFGCGTQGLLLGDAGLLLLQFKLRPTAGIARRLAETVQSNRENPVLELMWGAPGTMLAALAMLEWTGDSLWRDQFVQSAACLRAALETDDELQCDIWSQTLYGARSKLLGAVHGFAGNAFALSRGRHLLPMNEWDWWSERLTRTLMATAKREDGCLNWPQSQGTPRPGRTAWLLQHCHGAPGIVTSFAGMPGVMIDDILHEAGEFIWRAGPLRKGANLCHGTAGNGYAFLKLYQRFGNPVWLERARAFSVHAMAQCEVDRQRYRRYRYSLWTGDIGVAFFLWSCIHAQADFPTLDMF